MVDQNIYFWVETFSQGKKSLTEQIMWGKKKSHSKTKILRQKENSHQSGF